jgi:LuxR family maltose regulon positive regulatory protein
MPGAGARIAFVPRLPERLVPRLELRELIERESRRPLLIVRAPAGGGKSTALADWALGQTSPGAWVAVDRGAAERLTFWRRVVAALVTGGALPPTSPLHDLVVSGEIAEQLRTLLLQGLASTGDTITLVLDDFHEATDEAIAADLHWLLAAGAPLRLVIATRVLGPLEEPSAVAEIDTALILSDRVAFDAADVERAAELFGVRSASDELLSAFHGWPLPTRAALVQLASGRAPTPAAAIARVRAAGDSHVIEAVGDPEYREFLGRISIAQRVTARLARELSGTDDPAPLARAERDGLGTWADGTDEPEFVLHPYLREQLEAEFLAQGGDALTAARSAYARDRIEHGDPLEAARQFAALGDGGGLVDLVRLFYPDLYHALDTFAEISAALPEAELLRHPELLTIQMLAANSRRRVPDLKRAASLIASAASARMGRGRPEQRVGILLSLLAAQRLGGHYDQAVRTADHIAGALDFLDEQAQDALRGLLPTAWNQVATTHFYADRTPAARDGFREANRLAAAAGLPWIQLHADSLEQLVLAVRGDMAALEPRLVAARERTVPSGWHGTYTASGHHLAEAIRALEHFDGAAARSHLEPLRPHEWGIEHWPVISYIRALSTLVDAQPYLGLQGLAADAEAHAERPAISRPMSALLTATRAELLLADRQPQRAASSLPPIRRTLPGQLVQSRLDLILGREAEALRIAMPIAYSERDTPRAKAAALLVVATAAHRLGRSDDARRAVDSALGVLATAGLRRPLMGVPRADLSAALEAAGVSSDQVLAGVPDVFSTSMRGEGLTATERRVLELLEETGRVDELAARLYVSANTIKSHLRRLYRKLGVRSRGEALAVAQLEGLLDASDETVADRRDDGR